MLRSARKFFWDRRRTFLTFVGLLGGTWFLVRHIINQLEEMRDKVVQDRNARENLRKRFQQNQEDCTYHVLALAPSLGNAILEEMDVESITLALQQHRAGAKPPPPPPALGDHTSLPLPGNTALMSDSMISSAATSDYETLPSSAVAPALPTAPAASFSHQNLADTDAHNTLPSPPFPRSQAPLGNSPPLDTSVLLEASSSDWVAEFHAQQARERRQRTGSTDDSPSRTSESLLLDGTRTSTSLPPTETDEGELRSESGRDSVDVDSQSAVIIDSVLSSRMSARGDSHSEHSFSEPVLRNPSSAFTHATATATVLPTVEPPTAATRLAEQHPPVVPAWLASKGKAELWKEMKILAFTRALTILYSLTILSLFTHIQLNLLGTRKYVQSIKQVARENARAAAAQSASIATLLASAADLVGDEEDGESQEEMVTEETERKFLTLGWWLLNVGWKDVAERVRSAVEVVFSGISLKSQLEFSDVEQLISDVRKRVEYQDPTSTHTVNFLGALIPGGELDQEFVLSQGGLSSQDAHIDASLRSLIRSTCLHVSSADFGVVLHVCLDRGTDILIRGLREEVFGGDQGGGMGHVEGETVRLAAMLPAVTRWSHLAVNGIPNELVESLSDIREMTAFSAIMYSSSIDEMTQ